MNITADNIVFHFFSFFPPHNRYIQPSVVMFMHRLDLTSLPARDRTQLAKLIQQYATPQIVNQHLNAPPEVHND